MGKGFSIAEMKLLSLLMNGRNLQINNECAEKTDVGKCDSAHMKPAENVQIRGGQVRSRNPVKLGLLLHL